MSHVITHVTPKSIASRLGIQPGDSLVQINGEDIIDQIDYQALSCHRVLQLSLMRADGTSYQKRVIKDEYEPLGLQLEETLVSKPRHCHNKCIFCFIDQMRPGLRPSLYVKDDDWRLSLMMGNYVTLTNVSDQELNRIIRRHATPLYISVHSTDPQVRCAMMSNPNAGELLDRLKLLKENGISFHCQVVLCHGWNDAEVLKQTLKDLEALMPAALSVALVPVGMTGYRQGLTQLTPYTQASAYELVRMIEPYQECFLKRYGTRFVFPSDEFYCLSELPIPDDEHYEDYPQIENGVGLVRQFWQGVHEAWEDMPEPAFKERRVLIACGVSIAPQMRKIVERYAPSGVKVTVQAIQNDFFGRSITVTGLISGSDLINQLAEAETDQIMISESMLRSEGDLFLDNLSLDDVRSKLPAPLTVCPNDGRAFYELLCGLEG
ncbi:MAG: DUF512 domain-containing protein [Clostridia bacterium]|nr:DUF512 domain-containing protein [Clostridia bacterium]